MNEADSPDQSAGAPAPIEPLEMFTRSEPIASEVTDQVQSEDWQTVDFPGAISVDAISHRLTEGRHTQSEAEAVGTVSPGIIHYSSAEISPAVIHLGEISSEAAESKTRVQQLQQENAALRDRLQTEQALVQQIEGQLAAVTGGNSFEPAQEHLQQLLQELERSHQAAQRQQVLVETLTEQLGSSQERIAQLERDCALTRQRHNEQVQQVLQAESTCRDLRLRLHRQQQQTLQFKAALEKCLEMPTGYGYPAKTDATLTGDAATLDAAAVLLPKNSPVRPWSLAPNASNDPEDLEALPRSLTNLLNSDSAQRYGASETGFVTPFSGRFSQGEMPTAADQSALLDPDDPQFVSQLMQLILPTDTVQPADAAIDVLQAESLLDPSPVLGTECNDADVLLSGADSPTSSKPEEFAEQHQPKTVSSSLKAIASTSPMPLTEAPSSDPLWDGLETLIDLPLRAERVHPTLVEIADCLHESTAPAQTSAPVSGSADRVPLENRPVLSVSTSTTAIPPIFATDTAPLVEAPLEDTAETAPLHTAWTWRDRLVSAGKATRLTDTESVAQSTSQHLALSSQPAVVQQPVNASSRPALTPTSFVASPSPIVHPSRSAKKLASLAAVDLPMFPRR